jgi:serine/threonine protein kinase
MAEVFLGMQEGIGGFEKLVVIKRIFQHYCEDERFVQMFMDEARLAASIRHPNVVEILDIDRDATGFFIVMEYLSGETLGYVIPTLQSQDLLPPPHLVCRIAAAIAAGLHQAHTAHDATGAPQPVVHRDVTPSNVIVCYNGVVKLLDFGVAKAIMSGEGETRVRGVKGKLSYLAPEQIANAPVDARTDIFQLGIVIHEMLTGRGLFHAGNAHQRVLAVMDREIPRPSLIHPDVPPILDDIVLAALERDPEKRVQSADELRHRLEQAITAIARPASDRDVGAWMREAFSDAYSRRLALERSTASHMRQSRQVMAASPTAWTPGQSQSGETSQPSYPGAGVITSPSHPMLLGSHEPGTMTMASEALQSRGRAPQRRRRTWVFASLLLLLVAAGTGLAISVADGGGKNTVEPAASPALEPSPPSARVNVATQTATAQTAPQPPAAEEPAEVVMAEEPAAAEAGKAAEPAVAEPAAPPAAPATYVVEIVARPASASIELDGNVVGRGSFAQELSADGNNHVLVISADGYKPRIITFRDEAPEREVALQPLPSAGDSDRRASRGRSSRRGRGGDAADTTRPEPARASEPAQAAEAEVKPDTAPKRRPESKRPTTDNLDPWAD